MKKEEIDQLISESFERANVKEFWDMYIENIKCLEDETQKNQVKIDTFSILFATCIITAQRTCMDMMREILYTLCCGE